MVPGVMVNPSPVLGENEENKALPLFLMSPVNGDVVCEYVGF